MSTVGSKINPFVALGYTGSSGWHDITLTPSPDPAACHCGAKALYKMGGQGFCKAHQSDAVTAAKRTRTRGEL